MPVERFVLPGSERTVPAGAQPVGAPDLREEVQVTVLLRRRMPLDLSQVAAPLGRAEFAREYGADPADVDLVDAFAQTYNLTVVSADLGRRSVVLSGTVASVNEAFGTELALYQSPGGTYRGRSGSLYLPASLQSAVVGVFGLDDRPQAAKHLRRHWNVAGPRAAGDTSYTPNAVAKLYGFPTTGNGAGQTVAIIELGGGFSASDLQTYFKGLGIATSPSVTAVSVDGATNAPGGDPNGDDGEVLLDIEVVGAIAPGAKIAVYFCPNTDQGFLDGISTAVHDSLRKPSVVSISWGGPESTWTAQSLANYDQAFQDAAALGVSICAASGDSGSTDGVTAGQQHVDFPASSPHVLACGGTRLQSSGGAIQSEVVWNQGQNGAGGGGVSDVFALPGYQQSAQVPVSLNPTHFKGRGVPDVSGDADPGTGYQIRVDGQDAVFGGTSAVAPLWAALIALLNQQLGKPLGFLHPTLYASPAGPAGFRDITSGNNGAYSAGKGWDACTGLGSPNGAALSSALTGHHRHRTAG